LVFYSHYEATYSIGLRNTVGCFQHKKAIYTSAFYADYKHLNVNSTRRSQASLWYFSLLTGYLSKHFTWWMRVLLQCALISGLIYPLH